MNAAAAVAGWVAAGLAGAMVLIVRRALGVRMDAVARACHELRGPITAARLGLSFGERSGELSADRLRAIDIELGCATLALLDLADTGRGGPRLGDLDRVDAFDLLQCCVDASYGLADRLGAPLARDWSGPRVAVWGDRLRLVQALSNLIANAIEHGGGRVLVEGVVGPAVVRIDVSDQGPGLPAPIAELTRGRRRGRRGHGLAIAVDIVEAHGGRIAPVLSGAGGKVRLELPLAPPA